MGAPSDFACSKRASLCLEKSPDCVHAANGKAADAATLCMKLRRRIPCPLRLMATPPLQHGIAIDEMGLCDHFAQHQFERPTCSNGLFSTDSTRLCDVRLSPEAASSPPWRISAPGVAEPSKRPASQRDLSSTALNGRLGSRLDRRLRVESGRYIEASRRTVRLLHRPRKRASADLIGPDRTQSRSGCRRDR